MGWKLVRDSLRRGSNIDGNSNELNAAYAADGYARIKQNSIGAVTTTFVFFLFFFRCVDTVVDLVLGNCQL